MTSLTTPKEVFYKPTPEERDLNAEFWTGNDIGIPKAMLITFWEGAKEYTDWWNYVHQFFKNPNYYAFNAGYNDAFETTIIYLWAKDPNSPHNKAT